MGSEASHGLAWPGQRVHTAWYQQQGERGDQRVDTNGENGGWKGTGQHHGCLVEVNAGEDELTQTTPANQKGQGHGSHVDGQGGTDTGKNDKQGVGQLDLEQRLQR